MPKRCAISESVSFGWTTYVNGVGPGDGLTLGLDAPGLAEATDPDGPGDPVEVLGPAEGDPAALGDAVDGDAAIDAVGARGDGGADGEEPGAVDGGGVDSEPGSAKMRLPAMKTRTAAIARPTTSNRVNGCRLRRDDTTGTIASSGNAPADRGAESALPGSAVIPAAGPASPEAASAASASASAAAAGMSAPATGWCPAPTSRSGPIAGAGWRSAPSGGGRSAPM